VRTWSQSGLKLTAAFAQIGSFIVATNGSVKRANAANSDKSAFGHVIVLRVTFTQLAFVVNKAFTLIPPMNGYLWKKV
jgi:hypothetical protein